MLSRLVISTIVPNCGFVLSAKPEVIPPGWQIAPDKRFLTISKFTLAEPDHFRFAIRRNARSCGVYSHTIRKAEDYCP